MSLNPTQVNGLYTDHTSLRFSMDQGSDLFLSHLKSVNYGYRLNPSNAYGTHPIKLPTGLGQYEAEFSFTLVYEAWIDFIRQQPQGFGALVRAATLTFVPRGSFLSHRVDFIDLRIVGPRFTSSQGQGGLEVEVTTDLRWIYENGICLAPVDADVIPTAILSA